MNLILTDILSFNSVKFRVRYSRQSNIRGQNLLVLDSDFLSCSRTMLVTDFLVLEFSFLLGCNVAI